MSVPPFAAPYPCLVADVGGTNARFAILTGPDAPLSPMLRLDTGSEADFARTTLRAIGMGGFPRPRSMLLAVAGPPDGKRAQLSNTEVAGGRLTVDGDALATALGLEQGLLFNDFEALSLSLPFLGPQDVVRLDDGPAEGAGPAPMVVVGPGTGLGVGGLVPVDGRWLPLSGEGGHVMLGPATPDELHYWQHLGGLALSAEDLLSGRGLSRLYRASAAGVGADLQDDSPPAVAERALAGSEAAAGIAVQRLFQLLARVAGDMALVLGARGGVFIGGGIAPRLRGLLDPAAFMEQFRGGGRGVGFLLPIPVSMIVAPDAALIGLASVARRPELFALDYAGRRWR
jgi:glucokinase